MTNILTDKQIGIAKQLIALAVGIVEEFSNKSFNPEKNLDDKKHINTFYKGYNILLSQLKKELKKVTYTQEDIERCIKEIEDMLSENKMAA